MVNSIWILRFGKNSEILMFGNSKLNKIKCKRSLLEVLGYWIWVLKVTEGFSGPFPRVGENDL